MDLPALYTGVKLGKWRKEITRFPLRAAQCSANPIRIASEVNRKYEAAMSQASRRIIFHFLRLVICAIALWFVVKGVTYHDHVVLTNGTRLEGRVTIEDDALVLFTAEGKRRGIHLDEVLKDERGEPAIEYGLRSAWGRSVKWLLFLAAVIHFPVVLPQAYRFQLLLRVQNIGVSFWECVKLSFAGNFLNFAAPLGSNAGDVFKAYFVSLHTPHKTEAVATVALDRFIGVGSLLLVVAIITLVSPGDSRLAQVRPYLLVMVALGIVGTLVYLSPIVRKYFVGAPWLKRLPLIEHVRRIDRAARTLAQRWSIVVVAILLTIFLQAVAIGSYFTVAVAMGMDADWSNVLEYYACYYTGTVIGALPGPPQGLGTVELAYRYFLAPFGTPSQIVCMALVIRIVVLFVSLPGLLVTMTGSYRPRSLREIAYGVETDPKAADSERELAASA